MHLPDYSDLSTNLNQAANACSALIAEHDRLQALSKTKPLTPAENRALVSALAKLDRLEALFCWDIDFNELPTA